MVAPGVAVTASHSVDDVKTASTKRCLTYLAGTETSGLGLWQIRDAYQPNSFDLAILTLERASSFKGRPTITVAQPSTRVPHDGELVSVVGYRGTELDGTPISDPLNIVPIQSTGTVIEEFPQGLGRWRPFPMLNARLKTLGGMSGGPAFDRFGHMVGVVSSSPSGECEDTFIALSWPILLEPFSASWPPNFHRPGSTLVSLSKEQGGLGTFVHGSSRVQRIVNPATGEQWHGLVDLQYQQVHGNYSAYLHALRASKVMTMGVL